VGLRIGFARTLGPQDWDQRSRHTKEVSIYDPVVLVKERTNSLSDIALVPYEEEAYKAGFEDMPRGAPDTSKIQGLIDYRPVLDLPEMLERIIAYGRERKGSAY